MILVLIVWLLLFAFSYLWVKKAIILLLSPNYPKLLNYFSVLDWADTNRNKLAIVWVGMILFLFLFQIFLMYRSEKISWRWKVVLLGLVVLVASVSYGFLSDDVFSYLFAGRTIFYYGENPYLVMPNVFMENDLWLRFMSNVDNVYYSLLGKQITYIYGPVFLGYSLIPFLIFGSVQFQKLYLFYKLMGGVVFVLTGLLFLKINPKDKLVWAYWFFNPVLIFEFLVNGHNDLIMIFLWVLAYYWWLKKKKFWGIFAYLLSVGVKYVSGLMGVVFLARREKTRMELFKLLALGMMLVNAIFWRPGWYYTWVYMALPFAGLKRRSWYVFLVFHLLIFINYFSYIFYNRWGGDTLFSNWIRWLGLLAMVLSIYGKKIVMVRDYFGRR